MNLTGSQIKDTYEGVLNIGATGLTGALQEITDGLGNLLNIQVSDTTINFSGIVTGNIIGTTGATGANGSNGANGATGATGPAGATGAGASSPITLETTNNLVSTAIGATAVGAICQAIALGYGAKVCGNNAISIGTGDAYDGLVIGNGCSQGLGINIGYNNDRAYNQEIIVGNSNTVPDGAYQFVYGLANSGNGSSANTLVIGYANCIGGFGNNKSVIGMINYTGSVNSQAVGHYNRVEDGGGDNTILGYCSRTFPGATGTIVLGNSSVGGTGACNSVVIGNTTQGRSRNSIVIGPGAKDKADGGRSCRI